MFGAGGGGEAGAKGARRALELRSSLRAEENTKRMVQAIAKDDFEASKWPAGHL